MPQIAAAAKDLGHTQYSETVRGTLEAAPRLGYSDFGAVKYPEVRKFSGMLEAAPRLGLTYIYLNTLK